MSQKNTYSFLSYLERMKQLRAGAVSPVVARTGMPALDELFQGFVPGQIFLFGGRPGMGTTSVLLNILVHVGIKEKIPVAMMSTDMHEDKLMQRLISVLNCSPYSESDLPSYTEDKIKTLHDAITRLEESPIHLLPSGILNFEDLLEQMETLAEKGVRIFIIDTIQSLSKSKERFRLRDQEVESILKDLKAFALRHKACIIGGAILGRSVDSRGGDKRPLLSDLRESGALEIHSDLVCFVYRPEYYSITEDEKGEPTTGMMELILARNRNGKTGTAEVYFVQETGKVTDPTYINCIKITDLRKDEF